MPVFGLMMSVFFYIVTTSQGQEDVLMSFVRTDPTWRWVTMYRFGPGSGWKQESSGGYTTCDLITTKTNNTNSWLISDFIPLNNAKVVTLSISFTARKCNINTFPFCKHSLGIYSNEKDVRKIGGVIMETILAGNFTLIGNVSADKVWSFGEAPEENVFNITFPVTKQGIYIGVRDTGACVALNAVRMTSRYCPQTVLGGAAFDKTGVTLTGQENKVVGKCIGMSENLANGSTLFLRCLSNGSWSHNLSVRCQCKAGYQPGQQTCQACSSELYKPSSGNTPCIPCPENTHSNLARKQCDCDAGYYRATGDSPGSKCTAPPSPPRDLNSTLIGHRVILLSWKRPLNDGGRNDLLYYVSCFSCSHSKPESHITANTSCEVPCDAKIKYTPSANDVPFTHVIINNLIPGSLYSFKVLSRNGVSGLGMNNTYKEIHSYVPLPVVPKIFATFIGIDVVVLSLSSTHNGRTLSSFVFSLSCSLCDKKTPDCVTCHQPCGNAIEYHPHRGFIDNEFTVVSRLTEDSRYKFILNLTDPDNDISNTSVICVTTKRKNTGDPIAVGSNDNQKNIMTLYSIIAFGLSAGLFLFAVVLLAMSLCLRKKWLKTATFGNGPKFQENIMYMEEIVFNNTATK